MKAQKILQISIIFELAVLLGVIAGIYSLNPEGAVKYSLYELLGAVLATLITTTGIYKMEDLT